MMMKRKEERAMKERRSKDDDDRGHGYHERGRNLTYETIFLNVLRSPKTRFESQHKKSQPRALCSQPLSSLAVRSSQRQHTCINK